jgi:hypothetical protein
VPACGFADCTRAASDPARPALRPVREELATGERRKIRSLFQKTQPEAEPEVTAWRVPRRSAERRARPQADDRGNATHPWRAPYRPRIRMRSSEVPVRRLTTRLSALRLPYFIRGGFRAVAWQSSGANKKRAARTTKLYLCSPHPEARAQRASKDVGRGARACILRGSRCARAPQDEVSRQARGGARHWKMSRNSLYQSVSHGAFG